MESINPFENHPKVAENNRKPWSLAFSLLKLESFLSTLPAASPQRVTRKKSHFFSVFFPQTACLPPGRAQRAGWRVFAICS